MYICVRALDVVMSNDNEVFTLISSFLIFRYEPWPIVLTGHPKALL